MPFSPYRVGEDGSLKFHARRAPVVQLARSIDAKLIYDSGFKGDLPVLFDGQLSKENMVRTLRSEFELPRAADGLILEMESRRSPQIQLAGIAAGLAKAMYLSDQMRSDLSKLFESVWLNGSPMSR